MKIIGTAKFKNFDKLLTWHDDNAIEGCQAFMDAVKEELDKRYPGQRRSNRSDTDGYIIHAAAEDMYKVVQDTFFSVNDETRARWEKQEWDRKKENAQTQLKRFQEFASSFEQPLNIGYMSELFAYAYFGNPRKGIVIPAPKEYLDYEPCPDYSNTTLPQLRAALGVEGKDTETSGWLPATVSGVEVTHSQMETLRQQQLDAKAELNAKLKQVRDCETEELANMKAEIAEMQANLKKRQDELMLDLEVKMDEAETKLDQLKAQIFMLDSQIYAIQCFAGETVNFSHVRTGANAPDTTPVIIYQKLRHLDEELGRMVSIYNIEWNELNMFEEFLRHSPAALDVFAPDERCITLVRISKTNTQIGRSARFPYSNMLQNYEYYHGRTVGIIIRNGENLYLGWTDEDRIYIQDDFIISRTVTQVTPAEPQDVTYSSELAARRAEREERKKEYAKRMDILNGVVSRAFVFNILHGIIKNTNWLPLPAGESLTKPSAFVRYSLADMCLEDHRFADFDKLIAMANADIAEGDPLLVTQYLHPDRGMYVRNDRGRGYNDRTHDVMAEDCTIYPVNLIEYDEPETVTRYKYKRDKFPGLPADTEWHYAETKCPENLSPDCVILDSYEKQDSRIFISLEKDNWRCSERAPRANFQLYSDEYINLAFMNSVWLSWAINTKNLGNWRIKGTSIHYAHGIRYLNTAIDFVRKREEEEKAAIDAVDPEICKNPEWPLLLSDWKFMLSQDKSKRSVRNITPFQAKRFAKWVQDGMPGRQTA